MQLTARGWWLLFWAFVLLTLGMVGAPMLRWLVEQVTEAFGGHLRHRSFARYGSLPVLVLLALALLAWFAWEWLLFAFRSRTAARRLRVARVLRDERGRVETLWVGRTFRVRVQVRLEGRPGLPFAAVADRLPSAAVFVRGAAHRQGPLREDEPLELDYQVRCPRVGRVRFEGVQVRLADPQGFFYHTVFVRAAAEYRVLPVLTDDVGQPSTQKRHNLLPPPGIHRLRQPGSGSELLNLRDYLPGDPPKTIAWKVSARRDRLITKEFENEVPVRCTLFVDVSASVRLGPPGRNALARVVELAAAVAQANTAIRDLTGLCLFDEERAQVVRPARTPRHLAELINRLTDVAGLPPTSGDAPVDALMRVAYPLAEELYPELMSPAVNRVPFWLARGWWVSAQTGRRVSRVTYAFYGLAWALATLLFLALAVGEWLLLDSLYVDLMEELLRLPFEDEDADAVFAAFVLSHGLLYLPFVRFVCEGLPTLFSTRRRRLARWRKRLSALLARHYALGAGALGILLEDNRLFSVYVQRFLAEHHVPYQLPLYDRDGRYLFAAPGKIDVLAKALTLAVGKGRDNELFVLLVDLLELADRLDPLLRAVKVALARHHQVVLICPWPPGAPPPKSQPADARKEMAALLSEKNLPESGAVEDVRPVLERVFADRLRREFHRVRQAFARLGVPVVSAEGDEPVRLVLERLERLRGVRKRR